jgi:hypothetical protein
MGEIKVNKKHPPIHLKRGLREATKMRENAYKYMSQDY